MEDIFLFVYGTLMQGQHASSLLYGCPFIGRFLLRDYAMFDLGSFPGILPIAGETVTGEVYRIHTVNLPTLDHYEGEGSLYLRRLVHVESAGRKLSAYAYIWMGAPEGCMMREPWGTKEIDSVWYACYGTNLSSERFSCYIMGGTCRQNGITYPGCRNMTRWTDEDLSFFPGRVYFGSRSGSWHGCGVAFYDPEGSGSAFMRLYKLTRGQLHDLQQQEGPSSKWYGRIITLGIHLDGTPVCTLTSEKQQPFNAPSPQYLDTIRCALTEECGFSADDAHHYLAKCLFPG